MGFHAQADRRTGKHIHTQIGRTCTFRTRRIQREAVKRSQGSYFVRLFGGWTYIHTFGESPPPLPPPPPLDCLCPWADFSPPDDEGPFSACLPPEDGALVLRANRPKSARSSIHTVVRDPQVTPTNACVQFCKRRKDPKVQVEARVTCSFFMHSSSTHNKGSFLVHTKQPTQSTAWAHNDVQTCTFSCRCGFSKRHDIHSF